MQLPRVPGVALRGATESRPPTGKVVDSAVFPCQPQPVQSQCFQWPTWAFPIGQPWYILSSKSYHSYFIENGCQLSSTEH